jgi:hypothetical protein
MLDAGSIARLRGEIATVRSILVEYGHFMGDHRPTTSPWQLLEADPGAFDALEPELAEGALLVALTVLWGARDGAHTIASADLAVIRTMTSALKAASPRASAIADVIRLVDSAASEEECEMRSRALMTEHLGLAARST